MTKMRKDAFDRVPDAEKPRGDGDDFVLVLDDELELVSELCETLANNGFIPIGATSAASAAAMLRARPNIQVLITDIKMPDADGLKLIHELGRMPAFADTLHAIVLTGQAGLPEARASLLAGAVDFLTKPVRSRDLIEAVRRACEKARTACRARAKAEAAKKQTAGLVVASRQVRAEMVIAKSQLDLEKRRTGELRLRLARYERRA